MKKFAVLPIAALLLAACSESPVGVEDQFAARDVYQSGNGSAFHGYAPPTLQPTLMVDGDAYDLTVCAAWSGTKPVTNFFSFDFSLQDSDSGEWVSLGSVRGNNDGANACYTLQDIQPGAYAFRVVGMARTGKGSSTQTHHTNVAEESFTVGEDVFTAQFNRNDFTVLPKGPPKWEMNFAVLKNGQLVTDCTDDYTVHVTWDDYEQAAPPVTCSAADGKRHTEITNPNRDEIVEGSFVVKRNGTPIGDSIVLKSK